MNKKLKDLGKKVDVSEEDIKEIKKERWEERIIYIITGVLCAFFLFAVGIRLRSAAIRGRGYPYAVSALPILSIKRSSSRGLNPIITTIWMTLFTLTLAMFLYMPMYGVYFHDDKNSSHKLDNTKIRGLTDE